MKLYQWLLEYGRHSGTHEIHRHTTYKKALRITMFGTSAIMIHPGEEAKRIGGDGQYGGRTHGLGVISTTL